MADDDALLREGIASLPETAGHQVVGRARDAPDLLVKVRSYVPDVAIVDVRMPPGNDRDPVDGRDVDGGAGGVLGDVARRRD